MKQLTIKDLRALQPCYDPAKYLPETWSGTLLDILEVEKCPAQDRIWIVLSLVPKETAKIFAIDCAVAAAPYVANSAADAGYITYANSAATYAADAVAYTAADAIAQAAIDAAAYAAAAAAAAMGTLEHENQIDALIFLLKGGE